MLLLCNYCKRRKVKCDRGRPCSLCIKYNVAPLCAYTDPTWTDPVLLLPIQTGEFNVQRFQTFSDEPPATLETTKQNEPLRQQPSQQRQPSNAKSLPPPAQHDIPQPGPALQTLPPHQSTIPPNPSQQPLHSRESQTNIINGGPQQPPQHLMPPPIPSLQVPTSVFPANGPSIPPNPTMPPMQPYGTTTGYENGGQAEVLLELIQLRSKISEIEATLGSGQRSSEFSPTSQRSHGQGSSPNQTNQQTNHYATPVVNGGESHPYQDMQRLQAPMAPPFNGKSVNAPTSFPPSFNVQSNVKHLPPPPPLHPGATPLDHIASKTSQPGGPWDAHNSSTQYMEHSFPSGAMMDLPHYHPDANPEFIGVNPCSPLDVLNIHQGVDPIWRMGSRIINYQIYTWVGMVRSDSCLNMVTLYIKDCVDASKNPIQGIPMRSEQEIQAFTELYTNKVERPDNELRELKRQVNKHTLLLGLTVYEGVIDPKLQLAEKISMLLPNRKAIWMYIRRFFDRVYPYMPFIDEWQLYEDVERIIGPQSMDSDAPVSVAVKQWSDFASIGIFLILLRATYILLFSNQIKENETMLNQLNDLVMELLTEDTDVSYLMNNPVPIEVSDMAQLCFEQFDRINVDCVEVVQLGILIRFLQLYSPDLLMENGNSQMVMDATLIRMAILVGLNREPTNSTETRSDLRKAHLARKLWFVLIGMDMELSIQLGVPRNVFVDQYDVRMPFYTAGAGNSRLEWLEKDIANPYNQLQKIYQDFVRFHEEVTNMRYLPKQSKVLADLSRLEHELISFYGDVNEFLKPFDKSKFVFPCYKVLFCRTSLIARISLCKVMFFVMNINEKHGFYDHMYFYQMKMLAIFCYHFIPQIHVLLFGSEECFGEKADLFILGTLVYVCHLITNMTFSIVTRASNQLWQLKQDQRFAEKMKLDRAFAVQVDLLHRLCRAVTKIVRFFIATMLRVSQRYYAAWKFSKSHSHILKICRSDDFHAYCKSNGPERSNLHYNADQVKELTLICENALDYLVQKKHPVNLADELEPDNIQEKPSNSTPHSMGAGSSQFDQSDLEELNLQNDASIDQMWLQMLQIKQDGLYGVSLDVPEPGDLPYADNLSGPFGLV